MKKLYLSIVTMLIFNFLGFSQEIMTGLNPTFVPSASWVPTNHGSSSGYVADTRTADGSQSYKLYSNGTFNSQIVSASIGAGKVEAGTYRLKFYIKSATIGARVKSGFFQSVSINYGTNIAHTTTTTGWELVERDFTIAKSSFTVRIISDSNIANDEAKSFQIDDVSFKRITTESPYSYNFLTNNMGWYGSNVTSSLSGGTINLLVNNNFPKLKQFDNYVNATTYKFVKIELKNNSVNDAIQITYPKASDGVLNFISKEIAPSTAGFNVYEIDLTNVEWTGNIEDFNIVIKKKTSPTTFGSADQTGSIDFKNITFSKISTLGLTDVHSDSAKTSLYPNPVKNVLNVDSESKIQKLDIFDLQGKKVKAFNNLNSNSVDVSSVANGIYLVKIINQNGSISTKKFIKN